MTVPQFQEPEPDSPARAELLEDNLMEDEQTPLLVPTGGGRPPFPEPDSLPDETVEQQELDPEPAFSGRPALEATAFVTEEEAEPEPEPEPEVLRVAQEMTSPDAYPTRQPASRSAVRSRPSVADDDLGNEPWQAPQSRAKKIVAVLVVAAGLGAGAAALMIGLGKKTTPSSMTLPQTRAKKVGNASVFHRRFGDAFRDRWEGRAIDRIGHRWGKGCGDAGRAGWQGHSGEEPAGYASGSERQGHTCPGRRGGRASCQGGSAVGGCHPGNQDAGGWRKQTRACAFRVAASDRACLARRCGSPARNQPAAGGKSLDQRRGARRHAVRGRGQVRQRARGASPRWLPHQPIHH